MDLVSRIHSTKVRSTLQHRSFVLCRFAALRNALTACSGILDDGSEVLEYFPVAAVAAMETYFRFTVAELVNVGHHFLDAVDDLMKEKDVRIDSGVIKALHGQKVTIGEVLAYPLSYSTRENIARYMSRLLGKDFLVELRSIWPEFVERAKPPSVDYDTMMRDLARTYEWRHIFCHEAPTEITITVADANQCLEASVSFVNASEYLIANMLMWRIPPTSGAEAFEIAKDTYEKAAHRLETSIASLLRVLPDDKKDLFAAGQEGWLQYRGHHADLLSLLAGEGGSMLPIVHYEYLRELTDIRFEQIEEMVTYAAERYGQAQLGGG